MSCNETVSIFLLFITCLGCTFFKKKSKKNENVNKRKRGSDNEEEIDISIEKIDNKKPKVSLKYLK